jgi:P pilus assembly chaperone PapD
LRGAHAWITLVGAAFALSPLFAQTPPAGLQISATKLDFGEAAVDSESPAQNITLSNPTQSNITMEQIIASGIDFTQKNDCGQALAPGAQCTIQVFFKPMISGLRLGNLDVMGSDPASPHFIPLTGTGI